MHVVTCYIGKVLPVRERIHVRASTNGGFPFFPEHLGRIASFSAPAGCDAVDLWQCARREFLEKRRVELPPLREISIRRLHHALRLSPTNPSMVVIGVWKTKTPAFQLMLPADTCPAGFACTSTPTIRSRIKEEND